MYDDYRRLAPDCRVTVYSEAIVNGRNIVEVVHNPTGIKVVVDDYPASTFQNKMEAFRRLAAELMKRVLHSGSVE